MPETRSTAVPSLITVTPGAASTSLSRLVSGVRTRTPAVVAWSTKSSTLASVMSLPRPSTTSRVAVCAISLIRCEDTRTVRPSAASDLSSSRIQRTPSGSRPLTGSAPTTAGRRRPAQPRGGPAEALPHPQGEPAGPGAGDLGQPGQLDHLIDPAAADAG